MLSPERGMLTKVSWLPGELPQLILPIRSGYAGHKQFCRLSAKQSTRLESLKGRREDDTLLLYECSKQQVGAMEAGNIILLTTLVNRKDDKANLKIDLDYKYSITQNEENICHSSQPDTTIISNAVQT